MKTGIQIALITIVITCILLMGCEQAGLGFYKLKGAPKSAPPKAPTTPLADGCYLVIDGSPERLGSDKTECRNLFIALEYKDVSDSGKEGKRDMQRLLKVLGYEFSVERIVESHTLAVHYRRSGKIDRFSSTHDKFSSASCEHIIFFGMDFHCFNELTTGSGYPDHMGYIIPYATVLRYSAQKKYNNGLIGSKISGYDFVRTTAVQFYDGMKPPHQEEFGCAEKAKAMNPEGAGDIYICGAMFKPLTLAKKVLWAGTLHHETAHSYDRASSNYVIDGVRGHMSCDWETETLNCDKDWKTVYGVDALFLFSISENPIFSMEQRCSAYEAAEEKVLERLMRAPDGNPPRHAYSRPPSC